MVEKMKHLFLDTETTGLIPGTDRLCSLAYKVDEVVHHNLYQPLLPISIEAMAVHHITNEMVATKPAFSDSPEYQELATLLPDTILVAHNAPFDIAMLAAEGLAVPHYICTLRVARGLDSEGLIPSFGLQYLRYLLKIDIPEASAHNAAGDVAILEALFHRLQEKISIEEMLKVSQQPMLLHRINFGKHRGKHLKEVATSDKSYLQWLLREKRQLGADGKPNPEEADWIYTLEYYLKLS